MSLKRLLDPPLAALVDLVYPNHCAACGDRQENGELLCADCRRDLPRLTGSRCEICCRPYEGSLDRFACPNCRGEALHMDFAVAVMRSTGVVRDLIHRFKYGRELHLRKILAEWLMEAFEDERLGHDVVLVPVPLHPVRQRDRQFNQSEMLAEYVAQRMQLAVEQPLRRIRATVTQTHFDRKQRMRNLRGAFALRKNARVKDKSLLLVDDVLTTGSTLDECARVLLAGGARSVRAMTVARG